MLTDVSNVSTFHTKDVLKSEALSCSHIIKVNVLLLRHQPRHGLLRNFFLLIWVTLFSEIRPSYSRRSFHKPQSSCMPRCRQQTLQLLIEIYYISPPLGISALLHKISCLGLNLSRKN